MELNLSVLQKTWIFDIDGTILKHNGYLEFEDELLPGVKEFFDDIPKTDYILILTGRKFCYAQRTIDFLNNNKIRFDKIIFDIPLGERILFNDIKVFKKINIYSKNQ